MKACSFFAKDKDNKTNAIVDSTKLGARDEGIVVSFCCNSYDSCRVWL